MDYTITELFSKHTDVRETMQLSSFSLEQLSEVELLSAFLQTGAKQNTLPLSEAILSDIPLSQFHQVDRQFLVEHGVSEAKASSLLAILELARRSFAATKTTFVAKSCEGVAKRLIQSYGLKEQEHLVALYMDSQNVLIEERVISIGTINRSIASPRDILKYALRLNAASIIVAHNHPSGNFRPSSDDDRFTKSLGEACKVMDVACLDHIIVGRNDYYSYREATSILG